LGGSKEGKAKAIRNTFIIFLVSGFWHGASWNFIAWGFIHACGFLPLLLLKRNRRYTSDVVAEGKLLPSIRELFQMLGTFAFVSLAWVFFRAETCYEAFGILKRVFLFTPGNGLKGLRIFTYIIPLVLLDWKFRDNDRELKFFGKYNFIFYLLIGIWVSFLFLNQGDIQDFIYFQF
jgi:hypothetical protein